MSVLLLQDDLQQLQMKLVQRQLAEPGMALSPALLFGDLSPWAGDPDIFGLLKDVSEDRGNPQSDRLKLLSNLKAAIHCV